MAGLLRKGQGHRPRVRRKLFWHVDGRHAKCAGLIEYDVVDLGHGKHFLQETHPERIGSAISRWFANL